jgi:hypothetical protein
LYHLQPLACPARFERATYALEAGKMSLNNTKNNEIKVLAFGVAYAPRTLVLGGMPWILGDRQVFKWSEVEFVGLTDKLELS